MAAKQRTKSVKITFRCTDAQRAQLGKAADELGMPLGTYLCDKLFNGKERNHYARMKISRALVTVSNDIDQLYNLIEENGSGYIETAQILPIINHTREELGRLWKY